MNSFVNIFTARNSFIACLAFAAMILIFLAPKAAVNVDEQLHYPHAKKVVNWYFTGGKDASCLDTPVTNLKYYGQSVDNLTALVNRIFNVEDEFQTRHFTGAFFFWLLLLFAGLIGFQLSGSYWVSALTVVSLLAMPRLFGQAFGNLKDIPFATGYLISVFFMIRIIREMPGPKWNTTIFLGLAIAFTNSVRIGGLILFAYYGLALITFFILKPFLLKQIFTTKLGLVRLLGQNLAILLIGYLVGLLFWPFALQNIFLHPFESLRVMEHYKVSIRQIFEGEWFWSTDLPWYYLPKWLFISTPEFIFYGFSVFLNLFITKFKISMGKQLFYELFLLFMLFFPIIYVMSIGANLYSGVRQMLFILSLVGVFSAIGIIKLIGVVKLKSFKITAVVVYFILMILPVKQQAETFPADYIYFNSVSGGNKNAWSNYEYDYYFHGIKKSSEYLIGLVKKNEIKVASNCNLSNYFGRYPNIKYVYTRYFERSSADWDYGMFGVNYFPPELLKSGQWQSSENIKTFYHKGNPIVVLLKRNDKNDLQGFFQSENGNLEEADSLLNKAVQTDPNNVWLYVQLAKNAMNQKDFESFNTYLQTGRQIYADYEPFYLLEAQYWFSMNDFQKSKDVLNKLIKINPRYTSAAPLLKAVNEKLN